MGYKVLSNSEVDGEPIEVGNLFMFAENTFIQWDQSYTCVQRVV